MGGRDPVRELLLPPRLVPPPLHVSCREESWPGMEMDLAVDGGLGKTERGVTGVPQLGVRRRQGTPRAWRREEPLPLPPQCPGQPPPLRPPLRGCLPGPPYREGQDPAHLVFQAWYTMGVP